MKKIVFLFLCVFFIVPVSVRANTVYECDGNSIEVSKELADVIIVKRGTTPFIKEYSLDGYNVHIQGVECADDRYVFYGYATNGNSGTFYDGFFLVTDHQGNTLHEQVLDFVLEEEVQDVKLVDGVLFVVIHIQEEKLINGDRELFFDSSKVISYDINYQELNTKMIPNEILKVDKTEQLLLLYYSYQGKVDVGLDTMFNEYSDTDIFTIAPTYTEQVYIPFINDGILNGEQVENGIKLDYPGHYKLLYNGQEYSFTVKPLITGVTHLNTYDHPVTINSSGGNLTLNGESIISGTEIDTPGNYELVVIGNNGYREVIQFSISSNVSGVINGHGYTKPIEITFQGEAYLNSNLVTSPLIVEEEGDYILRVTGLNGYVETYEFSYHEVKNPITVRDIVTNLDIFILVIVVIGGVIIIKKK